MNLNISHIDTKEDISLAYLVLVTRKWVRNFSVHLTLTACWLHSADIVIEAVWAAWAAPRGLHGHDGVDGVGHHGSGHCLV